MNMNSHVNGLSAKLKGRRLWSTLLVLITLALGILIGTVAQKGALGKDKATGASDAAPGQQYDAKVIGVDKETDLAVIKIDPKKQLTAARLGNSDSLDVGDWVLAIGSPFGLEHTVTAGIISSKGRNIDNSKQFQSFLQTDAAINPGNSGGPLVNMNGEVVGINTAIFTQGAGSQGVGFALPSKTVAAVYNQIIGPEHKVTRGSIGV